MATAVDRLNGVNSGLGIKAPVKVATTANITLSGLQTIDGVSVAAGDRVLVRSQTDPIQNGIYNAASSAWTRALDFNGARDAVKGTMVFVAEGTTYGDTFFYVSAITTIGTAAVTFASSLATLTESAIEAAASIVPRFGSLAEAEAATSLTGIVECLVDGSRYIYSASSVASGGFQNTASGRWYKLTGEYIYAANPVFADESEAAQFAFDNDIPLWIAYGEATVELTPLADAADNAKARHVYFMEASNWRQRCIVTGNAQLWLEFSEEGKITLDAHVWDLSTNRLPVIYGGAHGTVYLRGAGYDTRTIASVRISARGTEGDYPIHRGSNGYKITIETTADLPSYLEVGMAVGIQNPHFDNDGRAAAGAAIIESITLPRTFTYTTHTVRAVDLVEPSASGTGSEAGSSITGLTAKQVIIPKTTLAWDTDFTVGASATVTGITQANPCVVTAPGHGFSNQASNSQSFVRFSGVVGMTELNGRDFMIRNATTDTFELYTLDNAALNSTGYTAYSSAGTATIVTEAWTGADVEGYLNVERNGSLWIQELGIAYNGWLSGRTGTQKDQDAIAITRDNATLNLSTAAVIAGAGDKCIRSAGRTTCFFNFSFIGGGGCQEAVYGQMWAQFQWQRMNFGPAQAHVLAFGLGTHGSGTLSQFTGGSRGLYLLSGSAITLGTSIVYGANTGIEGGDSRFSYGTSTQVVDCNIGQRLYGLSNAQGELTFDGNATDSQITENGEGGASANYGGARWNTSLTGNQGTATQFGEFLFGAGGTLNLDSGSATDAGSGVEINKMAGEVTSQSLTTAAGASATIVVTNSLATATSFISLSRVGGTNSAGIPDYYVSSRGAGSFTITIRNAHASAAFNGTFILQFQIAAA